MPDSITSEQYHMLLNSKKGRGHKKKIRVLSTKKGSKFNNVITKTSAGTFHSKKELKRWKDLIIMQDAGKISKLSRQVKFPITVNGTKICTYIADATYVEDGKLVVEDVKGGGWGGTRTDTYRLKKKLMAVTHGIQIKEV